MDTVMDPDLVPSNKICRTCRRNEIPSHLVFKNCSVCREKNRVKEARRAERRREVDKHIEAHRKKLMESVSMEVDDSRRFSNGIATSSSSSTSLSAGTPKLDIQPKSLHEMEGKEKRHAIKEMKVMLQKKVGDGGGKKPIPKDRLSGDAREFQSASSLYEKLKSKLNRASPAGKLLRFHGSHCIVAVTSINHEDRVLMVAKDLRKIARISFARGSAKEETNDDSMCSMIYDCRCLCAADGKPSGQAQAPKELDCKGIVRVTAELDDSHPHGLEGQKISVYIHH